MKLDAHGLPRERVHAASEAHLHDTGPLRDLAHITPGDQGQVGGKVLPLARLAADGLPVPPGFVVPVGVFVRVLHEAGLMDVARRVHKTADADQAARLVAALLALEVPTWLASPLVAAVRRLGGPVAVRSSGVDEDGRQRSFAGQHHTALGVRGDGVLDALRACWASLYSPGALAYRSGGGPAPGSMAVLVQRLISPRAAGVMFTINPMTGSWREMTVEATWGLAEGLVSGQVSPHWFLVRRPRRTPRPVQRVLARVRLQRVQEDVHPIDRRWVLDSTGGVRIEDVPPALRERVTLPPHDLRRLCRLGLRIEARMGAPQDIEWALDADGRLWILQARPVTTSAEGPRQEILWTRRFVGERFPDPVTPLGWSLTQPILEYFIAYPGVQQRHLGGGPALRLVHGRPYLNATVFQHLAFKLPGSPPPRFMLEILPPDQVDALRRRFAVLPDGAVYRDILAVTWQEERWRRFAWNPFTNPDRWDAFEAELVAALPGLSQVPTSEATGVRQVEAQLDLVRRYVGVHVCSLLFANLWDQGFESLLHAWLPEQAEALRADLVTTPPGNRTLEVNRALAALGELASEGDLARLSAGEPAQDAFGDALQVFLQDYGHRSRASWEVFTPRWRQDPSQLVPLLRAYRADVDPHEHAQDQERDHQVARLRMNEACGGPGRAAVLDYVLDLLRRYLLLRENQRFRFEELQWVLQGTLRWLGARLVERGVLRDDDDVRFLEWGELRSLALGGEAPGVGDRIAARRTRWRADQDLDAPPFLRGHEAAPSDVGATRLRGHGISPGRVTGRVRRLRTVDDGRLLQPGEILVAPAVDPGWTPLFRVAGGVVLELGSRLSHGAVIAREYRVPGVVNVDSAMSRLHDGQEVTVDGTRGLVFVHR